MENQKQTGDIVSKVIDGGLHYGLIVNRKTKDNPELVVMPYLIPWHRCSKEVKALLLLPKEWKTVPKGHYLYLMDKISDELYSMDIANYDPENFEYSESSLLVMPVYLTRAILQELWMTEDNLHTIYKTLHLQGEYELADKIRALKDLYRGNIPYLHDYGQEVKS